MTKDNPFAKLLGGIKMPAKAGTPGGGAIPQVGDLYVAKIQTKVETPPEARQAVPVTPKPTPTPAPVASTAVSTAKNPFLTLTAAPADQAHAHEIELTPNKVHSVEELGHINTQEMEAQHQRESNLNVKAEQRTAKLVLASGEEVKSVCDKLDSIIGNNPNLVGPPLIEARGYVQRLMVTLKERPEFDSFVIDKDVRNIMRFIRSTREESLAMREVKTVKKVQRQVKKEQTGIKDKAVKDAFNMVLGTGLNFGSLKLK